MKVRLYNDTLNPVIWDNFILNPEIKEKLLQINDKDFVKAYMDLAKYVMPAMKAVEVNDVTENNIPSWLDNYNEKQLKEALTKQI